jgi:hypothetical protein
VSVTKQLKMKYVFLFTVLFITNLAKAQRFDLGDQLTPSSSKFKLIGTSSATGVHSYRYIYPISEYMFGRKIGDIVIGLKNGVIVTTIYNLIPDAGDIGVPSQIISLIQSALPYPLALINEVYGINIDNTSISISRTKNAMTFGKDRIMYFSSVKRSLLLNN